MPTETLLQDSEELLRHRPEVRLDRVTVLDVVLDDIREDVIFRDAHDGEILEKITDTIFGVSQRDGASA